MRRLEDKILVFCLILFVAYIIALVLMGCTSRNQSINLLWHDSKCLLYVEGISAEQAGNMSKEWEFGECEIEVATELGEGSQDPAASDGVDTP